MSGKGNLLHPVHIATSLKINANFMNMPVLSFVGLYLIKRFRYLHKIHWSELKIKLM